MSDVESSTDLTLEDAMSDLTGFEIIAIQKHFGDHLEDLGGVNTLIGAVWALENRKQATGWAAVKSRPVRELQGYFADPDPIGDPDSEQGKERSADETTTTT